MRSVNLKALSFFFGLFIFTLSVSLGSVSVSASDKYPSRTIELVTPDPPGAYADLINRVLAKKLEKYLGVTVIPVNKPGGGDLVAATAIANAAPDGYTLGLLADGPLV